MPDPQVNDMTPTPPASASATPAPTVTPPATGTASVSATPTAKPANPDMSLEEAIAEIANLKHQYTNKDEEAKRHFKKLSAYETAEQKAQEAALSDVEKANKRATEAEAQLTQYKQQLITTQVRLTAQSKGIIDPELAALAIHNTLEYGDDGMPTNVDKALEALIKQKPYLAPKAAATPADPAANANATNETPPPASPAQTAQAQPKPAPTIPAMNPGRSNIAAPTQLPPGRIPSLADIYRRQK